MDLGIDVSSNVQDRIDQNLFDDSDDFSIPGVARRASPHANSYADQTDYASSFQDSVSELPALHRDADPVVPPQVETHDELAVNIDELNERMLDDSQSLHVSMNASQDSQDASADAEDDSRVLRAADDEASTSEASAPDSPTSRGTGASPTVMHKRTSPVSSPPRVHASGESADDEESPIKAERSTRSIAGRSDMSMDLSMDRRSMDRSRSFRQPMVSLEDSSLDMSQSASELSEASEDRAAAPPAAPRVSPSREALPDTSRGSHDTSKASARSQRDASLRSMRSQRSHDTSQASARDASRMSARSRRDTSRSLSHGSMRATPGHASNATERSALLSSRSTHSTPYTVRTHSLLRTSYAPSDSSSSSEPLVVSNANAANLSMPQLGTYDEPIGTHVDPARLVVYQDKLNKQLAAENEALKSQCDALFHIIQTHEIDVDHSTLPLDVSQHSEQAPTTPAPQPMSSPAEAHLKRRIRDLEAIVDAQQQRLQAPPAPCASDALLDRTTDTLQDRHESMLEDVDRALQSGEALDACVDKLRHALNQAHGVINAMRERPAKMPEASAGPEASRTLNDASRTAFGSSLPSGHSLRASVSQRACVSMDADEALEELAPLQATVHALTDELQSARSALDEAMQRSRDSSVRKIRLEEQLAATHDELERAHAKLEAKTKAMHEVHEASLDRPTLQAALAQAQADVRSAEMQQLQMEQQHRVLGEQLRIATERYAQANENADVARDARHACEAELDARIEQMEALQSALALKNDEVAQLRGEKDHLWDERREIMAQVHHFEQHLREVRSDTEQYGADLRRLQDERRTHADEVRAEVLALAKPRLAALRAELDQERKRSRALVGQKAYLGETLRAHEWLYERLCTQFTHLAPVLRKYGAAPPRPRTLRFRAVAWAVRAALRMGM